LFGWVEGKRWMDFRKPNSQAEPGSFLGLEGAFKQQANGYPGGILFDPSPGLPLLLPLTLVISCLGHDQFQQHQQMELQLMVKGHVAK